MKKLKHTPSPWEIEEDSFSDGFNIVHNDGLPGKTYVAKEICQGNDDGEADANLIAAAPDLLEALRNIQGIEAFINDPVAKEIFQKNVYPAIKKATGND